MEKTFKRKLIWRGCSMLLVFGLLVSAIYFALGDTKAWFSLNQNTRVTGSTFTVEAPPTLIISASNGILGEVGTPISSYDGTSDARSLSWESDDIAALKPATHDWTVGTATGLKYNTNPKAVSAKTGFAASGSVPLTFDAVPVHVPGERLYYLDYVFYLASYARPMENVSALTATLTETGGATATLSAYKALSVDIYTQNVTAGQTITPSSATFRQTLNLSSSTAASGTVLSDITVPENTDGSIAFLLRVYFDGALENTEDDKAFVNTVDLSLDTANVFFTVSIETVLDE